MRIERQEALDQVFNSRADELRVFALDYGAG
jgi:hypothetical protein